MQFQEIALFIEQAAGLLSAAFDRLMVPVFWFVDHLPEFSGLAGFAPFAIMYSAIVAMRAIKNNSELARKKATLDLIEKRESDAFYQSSHDVFKEIRKLNQFDLLRLPKSGVWLEGLESKRKKSTTIFEPLRAHFNWY